MCPYCFASSFYSIKSGFYRTQSRNNRKVQRYLCKDCGRKYSSQTGSLTFREHKPELTPIVGMMVKQGYSQRACAKSLSITQSTVSKKLQRLTDEFGSINNIKKFELICH